MTKDENCRATVFDHRLLLRIPWREHQVVTEAILGQTWDMHGSRKVRTYMRITLMRRGIVCSPSWTLLPLMNSLRQWNDVTLGAALAWIVERALHLSGLFQLLPCFNYVQLELLNSYHGSHVRLCQEGVQRMSAFLMSLGAYVQGRQTCRHLLLGPTTKACWKLKDIELSHESVPVSSYVVLSSHSPCPVFKISEHISAL